MVTVERTIQLARRRKLIAGAVVATLGVTVIVIALALGWSSRRQAKPLPAPRSLPQEINQQLSGYTFTRSDEGRQVFTVRAARTVAFKEGGTTVLEDVFVEVFGKTGQRRDVLRTRRCDYNPKSGDLFSSGKVEIELNAPGEGDSAGGQGSVYLETSKLSFRQAGSLVVSEEPVSFRIGPVSGSAVGMAYATRESWLELKKDVSAELRVRAGAEPSLPSQLSAGRARYHKESGEIDLGGRVEFTQASGRVVAEHGTVFLDSKNRIRRAVIEGGVQAFGPSGRGALEGTAERLQADFDLPSGELRLLTAEGAVNMTSKREVSVGRLEAQRVEVNFRGEQPQAERGFARGDVRLSIDSLQATDRGRASESNSSLGTRELTANEVEFAFEGNGRSLAEARTVGAGKLVLVPLDPRVGPRVITAGQFFMAFDERNALEGVRGVSGTEIRFLPPRGTAKGEPATSSSERLEATFDPATQELQILRQFEDFLFHDGDRQATAREAHYSSSSEVLTLTGAPQLRDSDTRVLAERITFDLRADTAEGIGKVRSTHSENASARAEPTNVLAARVVAKRKSEFLHYEGNVRAWRGTDVVEASSLDVYRAERRVTSGAGVRTSHLQTASRVSGAPAGKSQSEKRPVTIQANRLEYFDQGRKASYRGNVLLRTENTTLEADRVDVYFLGGAGGEGAEVDRAVAEGQVKVRQPMRRATGDRAEYFAAEGKILLTGGPPTLRDEEKGFTTGQRLTFFIRDDRLLVDGGDESPTVSKHRIAQ